jgi:rubrerythrin
MMEREAVCYTREVALEKAIEMEAKGFEAYKEGYLKAEDPRAKDLLRDLALDELRHKYTLEKAFFEETVALHEAGYREGPSMNLALLLEEKPLDEAATGQDVMIYAIHEEKRAVEFYKNLAAQCGAAPMEQMYKRLYEDEEAHLARLEALYESIYMQEM